MNIWGFLALLLVFGVLFRLGTRTSRIGWLIWAVPLGLCGLLRMGHMTEADAFLCFYLLVFVLGGFLCGIGLRAHKFFAARR